MEYLEHQERLFAHIDNYFGDVEINVFQEIPRGECPIDVLEIFPEGKDYKVLLTSGMSTWRMNVPDDIEDAEGLLFAELMLIVPSDLELTEVTGGRTPNAWLIDMLKSIGKYPKVGDTWLGIGTFYL